MVAFLQAAVGTGLNIMVSGGSSSGKTTLLNVLSGYIAHDERIVTIENAAELQLQQDHVVRLETRPANIEGEGEMTIRDLVINSLRMRPDRIIVGEVREGEALDLLQAMNTGHEGSMGTIHANSPSDALVRLETMCLMAGMDIPLRAVREQVAAAIDLVVQMVRLRDGSRKITAIAEVEGLEGDTVMLSSLFEWNQTGLDRDGRAMGYIRPTGITPRCIDQIESAGYRLSPSIFGLTTFDRGRARKTFKPGHEDEHPYELVTAEDQEAAEASAAPPPGQPL
jgi:pilus assembly protein CpaF